MLNRYSLVFYATAFGLLFFERNILAFVIFIILGYLVAFLIHKPEEEDVEEPLSFQEILLFKSKEDMLKNAGMEEIKETKQKLVINKVETLKLMAIYTFAIIFFAFVYKDLGYLILLPANVFLIVRENKQEV